MGTGICTSAHLFGGLVFVASFRISELTMRLGANQITWLGVVCGSADQALRIPRARPPTQGPAHSDYSLKPGLVEGYPSLAIIAG